MEPLPLDEEKTYEFVDEIVGRVIPNQYIPACDKGFQEQLKKGLLIGFPVIGVKMTINDGAYHDVDSSEMAFRICAQTAIREFYHQAKPVVLEPIMKVEVSDPEEFSGPLMGLVNQRRGTILGSSSMKDTSPLKLKFLLLTCLDSRLCSVQEHKEREGSPWNSVSTLQYHDRFRMKW